ncbi:MAG: HAD hydrolase-like protein [Frankiales bacterium]|nr:HAD hydrolase-like protein [Frankiales bacterium]
MAVIGFDLDMTLVDSADAIVECVSHTATTFGFVADPDHVRATVGLPLDRVFPDVVPGVPYEDALAVYRARYLSHGLAMQTLLPGADEALRMVVGDGYRVVVVSAKKDTHVQAVLDTVGLAAYVDDVVGERFADTKADALRERAALAYVGDHPGDVAGALGAGAVAVAVATGPSSREALLAAGGDPVLDDLTQFGAWWRPWAAARDGRSSTTSPGTAVPGLAAQEAGR